MVDLYKSSGLSLTWDPGEERIIFGEGITPEEYQPEIRRLQDIKDVFYDASQAYGMSTLYYMYRGVSVDEDAPIIRQAGLRFDLTVLSPGTIGGEYVKTAGHYDPYKPGTSVTWPEVYEVLNGRAHYLIQSHFPGHPDQLEKVILITAKPGDKVLIPPRFGHVTINPGNDYLIMSNWVADGVSSLHNPFQQMKGGAYYELQSEEVPVFVPNTNYSKLPALERCSVTTMEEFSLITGLPFYSAFKENNQAFRFLTHPEEYNAVFESYIDELACS